MTLITTIINSNIKCIASDSQSNETDGSIGNQQKIFLLKDAIVGIFEILHPSIIDILQKDGLNISLSELLPLLYKEDKIVTNYKNVSGNRQYTGIFIVSNEIAYLDFFPLGLRYNLFSKAQITFNNRNQTFKNCEIEEILNKNIILNIPLKDLGGIRMKLYRERLNRFMEIFQTNLRTVDFEAINENNLFGIIEKYYTSIYSYIILNEGAIWGDIHIAYLYIKY